MRPITGFGLRHDFAYVFAPVDAMDAACALSQYREGGAVAVQRLTTPARSPSTPVCVEWIASWGMA